MYSNFECPGSIHIFFKSLITNFGVFFMRNVRNTLKFAKTTPKEGYFWYIQILGDQIWFIWVFGSLITNFRVLPTKNWRFTFKLAKTIPKRGILINVFFCKFKDEVPIFSKQDHRPWSATQKIHAGQI